MAMTFIHTIQWVPRMHLGKFKFWFFFPHNFSVLFLLHGGGFSALSFSLFARDIIQMVKCRVIAPDIRGHGATRCEDDEDLSIDRFTVAKSHLIRSDLDFYIKN